MNAQIYEEASDWLVKHRDGGLDKCEKMAFDAWLRQSPQHVAAYLEMSSLWERMPGLDPIRNLSAEELIMRARADDNVIALSPPVPPSTREKRAHVKRNPVSLYTLAACVLVMLVGGWLYSQRGVYATQIGEQRLLTLLDGSTVEINSGSRIKVRYSERERRVDLEGQALFHVAKNAARPFIVQTASAQVRAVGTAFDVYDAASGTVVTVVEGRVAVRTNTAAAEPRAATSGASASQEGPIQASVGEVLLAAGEQLVVTPSIVTPPKPANVAATTAWTRRSLVFDSSPLTQVAQEFNRYNTRPLVIEDPRLAEFRVSGVFSSVEPTLLLRFLRTQPELVVTETDTEIRIDKK